MKRLSLLVLLVIAMTVALTACFGTTTPADTHVHTYTDDWCVDATNHWHAADCEHKDETIVKTAHDFVDGKCSVCGYYSYYTVTVNAPAGVTVAGDLTTKNGLTLPLRLPPPRPSFSPLPVRSRLARLPSPTVR